MSDRRAITADDTSHARSLIPAIFETARDKGGIYPAWCSRSETAWDVARAPHRRRGGERMGCVSRAAVECNEWTEDGVGGLYRDVEELGDQCSRVQRSARRSDLRTPAPPWTAWDTMDGGGGRVR